MAQTEHKDISVQRVNITTKNNYAKHIQSDFYTPQWFILTVSYKSNSDTLKGHLSRKHYQTTLSEKGHHSGFNLQNLQHGSVSSKITNKYYSLQVVRSLERCRWQTNIKV